MLSSISRAHHEWQCDNIGVGIENLWVEWAPHIFLFCLSFSPPEYLRTSLYRWISFRPYKDFLFNKRHTHLRVPKHNSGSQFFYVPSGSFKACIHMFGTHRKIQNVKGYTASQDKPLRHTQTHLSSHKQNYIQTFFSPHLPALTFSHVIHDILQRKKQEILIFVLIFLFLWEKKNLIKQQHNNEDSCLIPWFMRWSDRHPPPIPDGIAVNHGTMLYTHPCTNSRVGEKHESVFLKNWINVVYLASV